MILIQTVLLLAPPPGILDGVSTFQHPHLSNASIGYAYTLPVLAWLFTFLFLFRNVTFHRIISPSLHFSSIASCRCRGPVSTSPAERDLPDRLHVVAECTVALFPTQIQAGVRCVVCGQQRQSLPLFRRVQLKEWRLSSWTTELWPVLRKACSPPTANDLQEHLPAALCWKMMFRVRPA